MESLRKRNQRTITRPRNLARPQPLRPILINLEPHGPLSIKSCCRLSRRRLGHVELQRAGVANRCVDRERDGAARLHRHRLGGARADIPLVARHVLRGHVLHGAVGVVVGRDADGFPFGREYAVDGGFGEGVLVMLV